MLLSECDFADSSAGSEAGHTVNARVEFAAIAFD